MASQIRGGAAGLGSFCLKKEGSCCPCCHECVCLEASLLQTFLMPDGGGLDPNQAH